MTANINNTLRKAVYRRDHYRCALCDSDRYIQVHHIIPRGQGGPRTNIQNMITLCSDCHALAHGIDTRGLPDAWDDVERDRLIDQAIVEYMADLYACEGIVWNPWGKGRR